MKLILQITLFFIYFDALLAQDYLKYYLEAGFKNNLKLNAERKNYQSIKQNINISRSEFLPSISLSSDQSIAFLITLPNYHFITSTSISCPTGY